jgi:hypothetical protein
MVEGPSSKIASLGRSLGHTWVYEKIMASDANDGALGKSPLLGKMSCLLIVLKEHELRLAKLVLVVAEARILYLGPSTCSVSGRLRETITLFL